jgi:putative glutamine transport system substrate-binding protein
MVRKDAGLKRLADMDGRIAGVIKTGTTREALEAEAARAGIALDYAEFTSHPEIMAALFAGSVDAFVNDKSILLGYLGEKTMLLEEGFGPQAYGIATKLENDTLAARVEAIVTAMRDDGRLDMLIAKWG